MVCLPSQSLAAKHPRPRGLSGPAVAQFQLNRCGHCAGLPRLSSMAPRSIPLGAPTYKRWQKATESYFALSGLARGRANGPLGGARVASESNSQVAARRSQPAAELAPLPPAHPRAQRTAAAAIGPACPASARNGPGQACSPRRASRPFAPHGPRGKAVKMPSRNRCAKDRRPSASVPRPLLGPSPARRWRPHPRPSSPRWPRFAESAAIAAPPFLPSHAARSHNRASAPRHLGRLQAPCSSCALCPVPRGLSPQPPRHWTGYPALYPLPPAPPSACQRAISCMRSRSAS